MVLSQLGRIGRTGRALVWAVALGGCQPYQQLQGTTPTAMPTHVLPADYLKFHDLCLRLQEALGSLSRPSDSIGRTAYQFEASVAPTSWPIVSEALQQSGLSVAVRGATLSLDPLPALPSDDPHCSDIICPPHSTYRTGNWRVSGSMQNGGRLEVTISPERLERPDNEGTL